MPTKHRALSNGNRFYVSDETHRDYIDVLLNRSLNGIPTNKGKELLPKISANDAALIKKFSAEVQATSHVTVKRIYKYHYILIHWREFIGEFRKNSIEDIYAGITSIQNVKDENNNPRYAANTLVDYLTILKKFYVWMGENKYTKINREKIRKIKPPKVSLMTKTIEQLLTEDEIKALITACTNSRDRAILATMYEGGFRIGEIASLRWRQVKFNDWNVAVNVDNKTLKPRYIPLVMARPYLSTWRNDYPLPLSEDGFVFVTHGKHEQIQYRGFAKQLQKIIKRAGIRKHITPHLLRHSRITHLIQQGFGESKIKLMMWGDINTDMFRCYAHLSNADIDSEVAQRAGIAMPEPHKKSEILQPRQCTRCYYVNELSVRFCDNCGQPLTTEAADKLKEAKEEAHLLPEYQAGYQAAMMEMQKELQDLKEQVRQIQNT
ncbi:MAG: putative tyrosine recombinase XerC-like protein [Methanoregula sp. PtaU1.Bin051]|nr:MAG: putative tyrosine recombinase XerC-like protein [Methanoregula sp. PtaU1.Bin051]